MRVTLDYETRSHVDLRKTGPYVYAEHESTEIMCMAYKLDFAGPVELWTPGDRLPDWVHDPSIERHAHNAQFERLITNGPGARRYGMPTVPIRSWHCTAVKAAAAGLPRSLGAAGAALNLDIQKDKEGNLLMMRMCKPRKPTASNPAVWWELPEQLERLYAYCIKDVEAEFAIDMATPPLTQEHLEAYWLDQEINDNGIPIDLDLAQAAVEVLDQQRVKLEADLHRLTRGEVQTARQRDKLLAWLNRNGCNVDNVQKATIAALLTDCSISDHVRRVLIVRQQLGRASTAKFTAMIERASSDGRVRGSHLYHGAATGRWAGRGVQFQNCPRGSLSTNQIDTAVELVKQRDVGLIELAYGDVTGVLSSLIRACVCL